MILNRKATARGDMQNRKHGKLNRIGFTMAEMLAVVAIIGVLAAVAFVALQAHQQRLNQLELDSVAKQIFVAAQNHLTMAKNENYLGSTEYGTSLDGTEGIYWVTGSSFTENNALIDQMLPFGSIDETVRAGNYIIYYQPNTGIVVDVFYTKDNATVFNGNTRAAYQSDESKRRRDKIGWYGGDDAASIANGARLKEPTIEIINAEKLMVKVTDPNYILGEEGITLQLIVSGLNLEGNETGAKKALSLRVPSGNLSSNDRFTGTSDGIYNVTLDDITSAGNHFAELGSDTGVAFVPGQDIAIQAFAYNTALITNIASSDVEVTNSLFEKIAAVGESATSVMTAYVNNIRHLENLDPAISRLDQSIDTVRMILGIQGATQTSDMSWNTFRTSIAGLGNEGSVQVHPCDGEATGAGYYMPVHPGYTINGNNYPLTYDGQNYSISDVRVSCAGNAGLFGNLDENSSVSNLALIDFDITSSGGNAGALIGTLTQNAEMTAANVSNVVAYNTVSSPAATVNASSGNAGGLIGEMTGSHGKIEKSAAALVVSSDSNAGGLIGKSDGGSVTACYSGGHTVDDTVTGAVEYNKEALNVTAGVSKAAGGLIGAAESTSISWCYSTCSVTGGTAGGLIGSGSGSIRASYCTGLVGEDTTVQGAFAGEYTGEATSCLYFEIINERVDTESDAVSYLPPVSGATNGQYSGVLPLDIDVSAYESFSWPEDSSDCPWKDATVYDKQLIAYYGAADGAQGIKTARYNLKTVKQLGATGVVEEASSEHPIVDFVATHYGDWPVPEIFVLNE